MNYNKPLSTDQKRALMEISRGSQKGRTLKLIDQPVNSGSLGRYDNLPVRGNWKTPDTGNKR